MCCAEEGGGKKECSSSSSVGCAAVKQFLPCLFCRMERREENVASRYRVALKWKRLERATLTVLVMVKIKKKRGHTRLYML
jgi:hypothetical protein